MATAQCESSTTPGPGSSTATCPSESGLTPRRAEILWRLAEERDEARIRHGRRRTWEPATERLQLALREFLRTLRPMRHPSAALEQERRRAFEATCAQLRAAAGVDEIFRDAVLTAIDPRLPADYHALAGVLLGLLDVPAQVAIVGDRGRGKTWLACAAVNAFCDLGRPALYRRTRKFFADLSSAPFAGMETVRLRYVEPQLLVLDEVQVRDGDREKQDNELTDLVDRRYARGRSTILLANLQPAELWTNLGASIQRRVIETGGVYAANWPRIVELLEASEVTR